MKVAGSIHALENPRRIALAAAMAVGVACYAAITTVATLFVPFAALVFLAPVGLLILLNAPQGRCAPKSLIMPFLYVGAILMPIWPAYIHVQIGPAPILTPPRILLYVVSAIWVYDMAFSPLRRAQFVFGLRYSPWIAGLTIGLFCVSALSVPIAEGTKFAAQEFIRQFIIWFIPFCALLTYVRRTRELKFLLGATAIGAAILGFIAVFEALTGTLLASILSPLISDQATWLQITQEAKSRDGVFRAQATHTHPISLGEYLSIGAPLALGFIFYTKGRTRLFWSAVIFAIVAGVLATNARGALLSTIAGLSVAGFYFGRQVLRKHRNPKFKPVMGLASLCLIVASPVLVVGAQQYISATPVRRQRAPHRRGSTRSRPPGQKL